MKWINKGHELDELGSIMTTFRRVAIYGAGMYGEELYYGLRKFIDVVGFIDRSPQKQKNGFLNLPVMPPESLSLPSGTAIIISVTAHKQEIMEQLEKHGFMYNVNVFDYRFLSVYAWYKIGKLFCSGCNLTVTQKCTLNCRYCRSLTPYTKTPEHEDFEALKSDVDLLFKVFDYVTSFQVVGGEPLLYPEISRLLAYVFENHRHKIGRILIITNGTLLPTGEVLQTMKDCNVCISISDYSETLPKLRNPVEKLKNALMRKGIDYEVRTKEKWWVNPGYEDADRTDAADETMRELFDACAMKCRLMTNGKYYNCASDGFALKAGFIDEDSGFSLQEFKESDKPALLEYEYGYSGKGYVALCRRCNGYQTINSKYVPAAEQV